MAFITQGHNSSLYICLYAYVRIVIMFVNMTLSLLVYKHAL